MYKNIFIDNLLLYSLASTTRLGLRVPESLSLTRCTSIQPHKIPANEYFLSL
jgi:hypothetical protein